MISWIPNWNAGIWYLHAAARGQPWPGYVTPSCHVTQSGVSHDTLQHPHHPPCVCWCQVYLCHMSLCFIFISCVTEVESVSGYTGPSFDGGRGCIRPFLYKPLKVIFLVWGTKGKYNKRIGKITYFMANVWQREGGSHGHIALPHCSSK